MVMRSLPPGFRFHPTDVELVLYYLKRKVMGKRLLYEAISEVNIYKFSPWDLPDKSCLKTKDQEWFFFCPREKKYASGSRVKRATENGYWKTTGKDRTIRCSDKIVGSVKTLVFHLGNAPHGERTDWVIYEYMILDDSLAAAGVQDTYVLCRVFKKNGMGPKNGAQYGAPFNEADWADDEIDDGNHAISFASNCPFLAMPEQTEEQSFNLERIISPGNTSGLPLHHEECPSPSVGGPTGDVVADEMDPSPSVGGQTGEAVADEMDPSPSVGGQTVEVVADEMDDEILSLLAPFTDESMLLSHENEISQGYIVGNVDNVPLPSSNGCDVYNGLQDQGSWGQMNGSRLDFSVLQNDEYFQNNMLSQDNTTYLELDDLLLPLDCPDGVTRANQSSLCDVLGTPNHENMQQFLSGDSFAVMRQHAPRANEVPWSDVLQMVNPQWPDSNASYTLDSIFGQLDNANYSANMERGSQKLNTYSSCNPADRLPSAAEHLAHTFSSCGGSSIHIKAEVTHGAGECTNEALSVMMGGSCSCWCNTDFFTKLLPLLVNCLLSLVAFAFNLILFYCFSRETVSWSHYYIYNYHPNENSTIILGPSSTSGNLVIYLPRNASLFVFFPFRIYFSYDLCVSRSAVCGNRVIICSESL